MLGATRFEYKFAYIIDYAPIVGNPCALRRSTPPTFLRQACFGCLALCISAQQGLQRSRARVHGGCIHFKSHRTHNSFSFGASGMCEV
jgi:hypothetical protein